MMKKILFLLMLSLCAISMFGISKKMAYQKILEIYILQLTRLKNRKA